MPDAARIAQARALEVPVIVQGTKTVEGTDRRELFTEIAKTTLVFDDGAVLNLQWKVVVGQVVFLHNQLNKKEVLCHVMEAPAEGTSGPTELQFTTVSADFWLGPGEQSAASAPIPAVVEDSVAANPVAEKPSTEQPTAQAPFVPTPDDSLDMMRGSAGQVTMPSIREELVAAHEMVPEPVVAAAITPPDMADIPGVEASAPTGEEIDAALKNISAVSYPADSPQGAEAMVHPDDGPDADHAKSEANLAALMARDARLAKYAAIKEQQVAKIQKDAAAKEDPLGAALAAPAAEEEVVAAPKIPLSEKLVTGKNANYTTIAAFVLIVIALGFVGNALRPIFFPGGIKLHAAAAPPKPKAATAPAPTAQKPAAAVGATSSAKAPATSTSTSRATSSGSVAASAPAPSPASSQASSGAIPSGPHSVDVPQPVVRAPKVVDATPAEADSADYASAQSKHRKVAEPDANGSAAARILEQPQPTFPAWAKSLDLDGVVTLDAVIDEKGNLAQTKVLSGPRQLQHAAEQAVGLWEFAPAQSGGKAVSSHMTLTVEFQR